MRSLLIGTIMVFVTLSLFIASLDFYLTLPTVNFSNTTLECDSVVDWKGVEIKNGCENLPKQFKHRVVY